MHDKMAWYRECCFPNCTKSWWKELPLLVLGGAIAPIAPLDPPLVQLDCDVFNNYLASIKDSPQKESKAAERKQPTCRCRHHRLRPSYPNTVVFSFTNTLSSVQRAPGPPSRPLRNKIGSGHRCGFSRWGVKKGGSKSLNGYLDNVVAALKRRKITTLMTCRQLISFFVSFSE